MEAHEASESIEEGHGTPFKSKAALQISVLALILALTNLGGSNSTKASGEHDIAASNYYSFYQAKNVRQTQYKLASDQLEITLASDSKINPAAKEKIQKTLAEYKKKIERYESEPDTGEGKKELMEKAKHEEHERDLALRKDPWFDYAASLLQIAIVLASVAIVVSNPLLLGTSFVVGLLGILSSLNGVFLLI